MIDSFVLYTDMYEEIKLLTIEQRGQLLDMIFMYAKGENADTDDLSLKILFSTIRKTLDRNAVKYNQMKEQRRVAGRKGGQAPRKQSQANESFAHQSQANEADTVFVPAPVPDNAPVPDSVSDSIPVGEHTHIPHSVEEVKKYAKETGQAKNCERFYNYYAARGWKANGSPVLVWEPLFDNWVDYEDNSQITTSDKTPAYNKSEIAEHNKRKYKSLPD